MVKEEPATGRFTINLEGRDIIINYRVVKKDTKFAYIRVKSSVVELVLPLHYSADPVLLLRKREEWLKKALLRISQNISVVRGDLFLYDGKYHPFSELGSQSLSSYLRANSEKYVTEKILSLQKAMEFQYGTLKFKSSGTWWGLCTSKGDLIFNYQLAALPERLRDYVVLHEVVHLYHHNHSKKFYEKLSSLMPDYKEREEELRRYVPMKRYR
ncbi:MAG: M48 family metallopeptidase [Thermoprotei archaeon]